MHRYAACPDQYNSLAPQLQDACWHVYQITTIGHGYDYCDDNVTDSGCTAARYNMTQLPVTRQPYIDFVERMIAVTSDEVGIIEQCEAEANSAFSADDLQVVVGGLSFGYVVAL